MRRAAHRLEKVMRNRAVQDVIIDEFGDIDV